MSHIQEYSCLHSDLLLNYVYPLFRFLTPVSLCRKRLQSLKQSPGDVVNGQNDPANVVTGGSEEKKRLTTAGLATLASQEDNRINKLMESGHTESKV